MVTMSAFEDLEFYLLNGRIVATAWSFEATLITNVIGRRSLYFIDLEELLKLCDKFCYHQLFTDLECLHSLAATFQSWC